MNALKLFLLLSLFFFEGMSIRSAEAVAITYPTEPWDCDPGRQTCLPKGDILVGPEVLDLINWRTTFSYDDNARVELVLRQYEYYKSGVECRRSTFYLGTVGELRQLTDAGKMPLREFVELKRGNVPFQVALLPGQCDYLGEINPTHELRVFLRVRSIGVSWKAIPDYNPDIFARPPAFESCKFMFVTVMGIEGVAHVASTGVAYIKPSCPAEMGDLKFTVGNKDFSSHEVDIIFAGGRTEKLALTIDGQPANQPVIRSPHAPIEIKGELPAMAAGSGSGVGWVRVEFP